MCFLNKIRLEQDVPKSGNDTLTRIFSGAKKNECPASNFLKANQQECRRKINAAQNERRNENDSSVLKCRTTWSSEISMRWQDK